MADKFAISFHETFTLSRSSLTQILENAILTGVLDRKFLISTSLGTNYQKAMPRYAYRAGLLDQNNRLTAFGCFAAQHDPALEKPTTQWLLHYHLSAPHGPTAFWHHLVTRRFLMGNTFSAEDLTTDLTTFLWEKASKEPAPRSVRSTVTVFTGIYLKTDGLNRLGLLEETVENNYRVPSASPPPPWALGAALADYWHAHFGGRLTVNLDDLTRGDFAAVFLLGEDRLLNALIELQAEGLLELYRVAQPYQIVLLQTDPAYALQRLYSV